MAIIGKKITDQLDNYKKNVEQSYDYFRDNYDRYNAFRRFVYDTSISEDERNTLNDLQKPILEFNIMEAHISRLKGEFSKQEPSIEVSSSDCNNASPQLINLIECHSRALLFEANNDGFEMGIYDEMLSGGFSAAELYTDYENEMSFNLVPKLKKSFDPTLCGWDPIAVAPHKGDGNYCFKLYPKTKQDFLEENPGTNLDDISFKQNIGGFSWSYKNGDEKILLVCDYYYKKNKSATIVKLSDGRVLLKSDYLKEKEIHENSGSNLPFFAIANKGERKTTIQVICRARFIADQILEHIETDYKILPIIFFDGNSAMLRDAGGGSVRQMTRPYAYHVQGIQKLKNFAGQTLANELENMVMNKWIAAKEGIPVEYKDGYVNPQQYQVLVYNQYDPDNPDRQLLPPREVQRTPIPQEVTNTFSLADQTVQGILGSYDASLGINDNQLSGTAIVEGATQSNAAAMPYIVGFLQGLNQVAQGYLNLFPVCYVEDNRALPLSTHDGKISYSTVNGPGSPVSMDYDVSKMNIKVKAGVNFSIQKSRAYNQLLALMQVSPILQQKLSTDAIGIILDNIEIRGVDQLKTMAQGWVQEFKQQQQMQQQMAQQQQQMNPATMKMQLDQQKFQHEVQQDQVENNLRAAEMKINQQNVTNDTYRIMSDLSQSHDKNLIQVDKSNTEKMAKAADLAMTSVNQAHQRAHANTKLAHEILSTVQTNQANQSNQNNSNASNNPNPQGAP